MERFTMRTADFCILDVSRGDDILTISISETHGERIDLEVDVMYSDFVKLLALLEK